MHRPDHAFGPTWRNQGRTPFPEEQTIVVCRCGVDMQFDWPRGQESVRCFGCGARYDRPSHLPSYTLTTWNPQEARLAKWLPSRSFPWLAVGLALFSAALIGVAIGLLLTRTP